MEASGQLHDPDAIPLVRTATSHWNGDCIDTRAELEAVEFFPVGIGTPISRPKSLSLVTNWAIPVPQLPILLGPTCSFSYHPYKVQMGKVGAVLN
jgi:hypothetical protein